MLAVADLFDEETVRASPAGSPGCWKWWPPTRRSGCARVEVLDAAERAQLVTEWNDTAAEVPSASVAELVMAQAAHAPEAIAVCCGDRWVTYRELAEKAARLGGYLRAAGAGPETVVGVCLDRGPEMVMAIVGTWLAGAAYLPVDPANPAARLAFTLADSRAAMVAGTTEALESGRPGGCR